MVRNPLYAVELNQISLFDLQSILSRRITEAQTRLPTLISRRNRIQLELVELNAEIESLSGEAPSPVRAPAKPGRKPGHTKKAVETKRTGRSGKTTLPLAIRQVLEEAGKPMNLAEIREAILEKGLVKNPKKSFPAMVGMALNKGERFRKVDRGVYELKA